MMCSDTHHGPQTPRMSPGPHGDSDTSHESQRPAPPPTPLAASQLPRKTRNGPGSCLSIH